MKKTVADFFYFLRRFPLTISSDTFPSENQYLQTLRQQTQILEYCTVFIRT